MGHWYKDGKPVYTVTVANGKERDTTLRDAKKHGYDPSVTTIIGLLDKPHINTVWFPNQILEAVLRRIEAGGTRNIPSMYIPEDVLTWKQEVLHDARTINRDSQDRGHVIHGQLMDWFLSGKINDNPDSKFILPVITRVNEIVSLSTWIPEKSFSHPLGFGGMVDLYSSDHGGYIIDFKTKYVNKDLVKV